MKKSLRKVVAATLGAFDPYNDFISEERQSRDRLKGVAEANKCVSHITSGECGAKGGTLRLLCATSSISAGRLRKLEVHCAGSEGSLVAEDFRIRYVGQ
jgi:hypothetical protein